MGGPGTKAANDYWRDIMERSGHTKKEIDQIEREIQAEDGWYDFLLVLFSIGFVLGFIATRWLE